MYADANNKFQVVIGVVKVIGLTRAFMVVMASFMAAAAMADVESTAATVSIQKYEFIPKEITVKKGETILWVNNEKRQYHSVWFEEAGDPEPGYFFPEETYSREFNELGTFPYRCGPHPEMTGVVHVVE